MKRSISASSTLETATEKKRGASHTQPTTFLKASCAYISLFFVLVMMCRIFILAPSVATSSLPMSNAREHIIKIPVTTGGNDCEKLLGTHVVHDNSYYDHQVDVGYGDFQYAQLCVEVNSYEQEHLVEISSRPASGSTDSDCDLYVADDNSLPTSKQFKYRSNKKGISNVLKVPLYAIPEGIDKGMYQSLMVGVYAKGGNKIGFINQCLVSMKISKIDHEDKLLGINLRRGNHNKENFVRKKDELKELSTSVQETLRANTKLARDAIKGLKSAKYRPVNEDFFDAIAQETIKEHLNEKSKGERVDADGKSVWGKFHGEKEDLRPKVLYRS